MKSPSRKPGALGACAVTAALALTSCGGGDGGGGDAGGERVYTEAINALRHFNPAIEIQPSTDQVGGAIYEQLIRITDEFELLPWLASDWELSEDELTLTLHLEEANWQDGTAFTSADVKYNFEEILPVQPYGASLASRISSVEAPDDQTVVIHLNEPYGPILYTISVQYMLPKHIYEGTDILTNPANVEPVGTGPLVVESFDEGSEVVAVANDDYWGGELAFDRAVFPFTVDVNARDLAIVSGEIDRSRYVDPSSVGDFEADPDLEVSDRASVPQFVQMMFNTESEILQDREVRALVNSAVDRATVTEAAMPETSIIEPGLFPEALGWAHSEEVNFQEEFVFDPDEINEALDEAGYPVQDDGYRFSLTLRYMSALPQLSPVANVIRASFEEVGVDLNLVGEDATVFNERVYGDQDFDIAIWLGSTMHDPSHALLRWYTCNPDMVVGQNASGYCDEELQEAFEASLTTADEQERAQYFRTIEQRAQEIMIGAPIVFNTGLIVHNTSRWVGVENPRNLIGPMDWRALEPKE